MVVPSTSDGSQAAASLSPSLDRKEGVSFHTFALSEDRCVRLLVQNLSRGMPKSVVQEELESLIIRVQGVTQLRFGRRDQNPAKDRLLTPTSLYQWREGLKCRKCDLSPNSVVCECRWNRMWPRNDHCNASAASALDIRREATDTQPDASRVGASTSLVVALTLGNSPGLWLREKPHGELQGLCEVE
jgi:hypothetical protein